MNGYFCHIEKQLIITAELFLRRDVRAHPRGVRLRARVPPGAAPHPRLHRRHAHRARHAARHARILLPRRALTHPYRGSPPTGNSTIEFGSIFVGRRRCSFLDISQVHSTPNIDECVLYSDQILW